MAFLRYTRYGLIIRAGVENRAMVTALGIDVKQAFTLVFAIGGVAAALAGVLAGVYFGAVDPHQGTSLLIFAFIVVVIGGLGSILGLGRGGRDRRADPAVRELLRHAGLGDLAVVLLLALTLLVAARRACPEVVGGALRRAPRRRRRRCRVFVAARARARSSSSTLTASSRRSSNSPGTLQLLGLMLVFGGVALTYDLLFGFTGLLSFGHALYFAVGVYLTAIAHDAVGLEPARRRSRFTAVGRRSCCRSCSAPSACASAGSRSRWSRSRSRRPARSSSTRTRAAGRAARRGSRSTSTRFRTSFIGVLNTKNLYWLALGYLAVVFVVVQLGGRLVARPRLAGDPRERARVEVLGLQPVPLQADGVRALVVPRHRRAASSTCC